jgi:diguanylate cyclase (GGDEF)-like protein
VYKASTRCTGGPGLDVGATREAAEQSTPSTLSVGPVGTSECDTVLQRTLSIITATTEAQLLARTLAAACEVTGATVAVATDRAGQRHAHGDADLARRILNAPGGQDGLIDAYAAVGLPSVITVTFGDGVIVVASSEPDGLGTQAASLVALLVAHAVAARDRLRELAELAQRADSDPLTGLSHHGPFQERLTASSPGRTAVIEVDVDGFKNINDRYGHQAGDRALVSLATELRAVLRDAQLYRIGGDEFAVILDVSSCSEVVAITQRLLDAARRVGHTISVGAAIRTPGETGLDVLTRADLALYQAKAAGRDTARVADRPATAARTYLRS